MKGTEKGAEVRVQRIRQGPDDVGLCGWCSLYGEWIEGHSQ